ncbi:MAG: acetyltransferase [Gammaproteobacteria bacterium]|nr:acetyltransferase [Gammaproteobacteria bacterium]
MKRLAVLGASGHGKVVADCATVSGWEKIVFYDDAWPEYKVNGVWAVVGNTDTLLNELSQYDGVIVAIGDNATRLKKMTELASKDAKLVNIIHPSAVMSRYVTLGIGSVVMPKAVINVDAVLGNSCIINTGATIDHDCSLGDGVHVSPGANIAGGVVIGNCAWLGIGSSVRQLVNIGEHTVVGAGAVVVNDIEAHTVVTGVPAKQAVE